MFKNNEECLQWVMSRQRKNHRAEDFAKVMEELANPQDNFPSIHVTGTNGKGSTCAYLVSLLMEEGLIVGSFHSPHYLSHLDRIRINNEPIDGNEFRELVEKYLPVIEKYDLGMFDIDFVVMCDYFIDKKVNIAIIEAGIGGTHDATNVLHCPQLAIITSIGLDHKEILGDTIEKIAADKAGIAKQGSVLLVGEIPSSCKEVVQEIALKKGCDYREAIPYRKIAKARMIFEEREYFMNNYADYQMKNASLALTAKNILFQKWNKKVDSAKSQNAIMKMKWPGRFEVVHQQPTVILDGAHNPQAIQALIESLDNYQGRKGVLFAGLRRKEVVKMIEMLAKSVDEVLLTSFEFPEALRIEEIEYPNTIANWQQGLQRLMEKYEVVVVCGSLYFLSEVANTKNLFPKK